MKLNSFNMLSGAALLSVLLLLGCVSMRRSSSHQEPLQLPVAIQPLFSACTPTDGSVQLSLTATAKNISGVEMAWNIPSDAKWDMQFNSLLGETQMEIQKRGSSLQVIGNVNVEIKRENSGALIINGVRLPVLDHELPCLMAGHWPASWLQILQKPEGRTSGGQVILTGWDELRSLNMISSVAPAARTIDSCTLVQWGGFLGLFKHSSNVCIKRWTGGYSVGVNGPSDYAMKWSVEHESS